MSHQLLRWCSEQTFTSVTWLYQQQQSLTAIFTCKNHFVNVIRKWNSMLVPNLSPGSFPLPHWNQVHGNSTYRSGSAGQGGWHTLRTQMLINTHCLQATIGGRKSNNCQVFASPPKRPKTFSGTSIPSVNHLLSVSCLNDAAIQQESVL